MFSRTINPDFPEGSPPPEGMPDVQGYRKATGLDLSPEQLQKEIDEYRWGTYGKSGQERLRYLAIRELETEHLENILLTQPLRPRERLLILTVLKERWDVTSPT